MLSRPVNIGMTDKTFMAAKAGRPSNLDARALSSSPSFEAILLAEPPLATIRLLSVTTVP